MWNGHTLLVRITNGIATKQEMTEIVKEKHYCWHEKPLYLEGYSRSRKFILYWLVYFPSLTNTDIQKYI